MRTAAAGLRSRIRRQACPGRASAAVARTSALPGQRLATPAEKASGRRFAGQAGE